jgi:hypothetical protein
MPRRSSPGRAPAGWRHRGRQVGDAGELLFRVFHPRFRLGDFGRERGDLLRAHSGINVVSIGGGSIQSRARLPDRRGQFDRRQLSDDVPRADSIPFVDFNDSQLTATSGAIRTSVERTTPMTGGVGSGRDSQ